ncbi:asparagine synthase (glutamine-hydrolyzing) [uncultured Ruminococcus sp.]|uniref:asparagine synthase (glutamine-hydrolyzing) n=1 Tax=uncultured Ruminococcus sp. TaxID=165186 RepID=UPI00262A87D0|nr:asparagine synthase (glutamine-hydrolyzing) [uncultured Ruminococcus sp.]
MCGITGMVHMEQDLRKQASLLRQMQETLNRRGPDQEGIFLGEHCALAHTRLAVIDVEHGRQPMETTVSGETYTIVYNGELYNTPELRGQLEREGVQFQTHCDTEVILQSYANWGPRCVEQFNGIFAFAIWEHHAQRLFLARDRIGVKPLFYAEIPGGLVFGSEIKALLKHPDVPHEIDKIGISELLLMGPGRTPGYGVFRTVREVKPAYCGYYMQGTLHLHPYWELHAAVHTESFSQTAEHVRELVTDAVRRQLVSDVPIGTFLSGGLDSSLLSSLACRELHSRGEELHTFSVDYRDNDRYFQKSHFQPTSDPTYIRCMERYLGSQHHWTVLDTPALAEALSAAVEARDLPGMVDVDSSLLLFCREIRQEVTVALSGECADELFGGYPWYRDPDVRRVNGFPWAQSTAYRSQFLRPEFAAEIDAQQYVQDAYARTIASAEKLPDDSPLEARMREMMKLNLDWFMQTLLDRKDRMSMYSALEVRVPFCDYRIAEYLYNVPWEYKDWNGYEKGLLRTAMQDALPPEVLWRKKSPYPKTHNPSYLAAVSHMLEEVVRDPQSPVLQLVRKDMLERLLASEESVQWYGQLMTRPQIMAYFVQINDWLMRYQVKIV